MDPFTTFLMSAAAGGLGNLLSGTGSGSPGTTGYDVLNFNDPYDAQSRAMSTAYMQDVLSALRAGQVPDWLNRFADQQQSYLLNQARNQMFGKEGAAGGSIADVAQSAGAMQGVGGAAASAPVNKALSDYADRLSGINQYIASLKNNYMMTASQTAPQQLYSMGARDNRIMPITQPGAAPDPLMQGIGTALGGIDFGKLFGKNTVAKSVVPQTSYGLPSSGSTALSGVMPILSQYSQPSQSNAAIKSLFPLTMGG